MKMTLTPTIIILSGRQNLIAARPRVQKALYSEDIWHVPEKDCYQRQHYVWIWTHLKNLKRIIYNSDQCHVIKQREAVKGKISLKKAWQSIQLSKVIPGTFEDENGKTTKRKKAATLDQGDIEKIHAEGDTTLRTSRKWFTRYQKGRKIPKTWKKPFFPVEQILYTTQRSKNSSIAFNKWKIPGCSLTTR